MVRNIITICSSVRDKEKLESIFLTEEFASPVFSVVLGLLTGIMGPVIFFSMITSITSLESINDLTNLGFKILRRFVRITFFVMGISTAVSLLFYSVFGEGTLDFDPGQLVTLLLGIIPTNIVQPFLENNTPQLVVMGFVFGSALLMLGNRVNSLKTNLDQIHDWLISAMRFVFITTPAIPFISVFKAFAGENGAVFLKGWEFIVGIAISMIICVLVKLIKVSIRCRIPIPVLFKKIWPLVLRAFSTGSETAVMMMQYEVSRDELGIKPDFSSFWIPMSQAMLSPKTTVHLILPSFLIAKDLPPLTTNSEKQFLSRHTQMTGRRSAL